MKYIYIILVVHNLSWYFLMEICQCQTKNYNLFFNERGENENISQLIFYTYIERKLLFQQMKALRLQLQGPSSHQLWLKNRNDFFKIINKARLVYDQHPPTKSHKSSFGGCACGCARVWAGVQGALETFEGTF